MLPLYSNIIANNEKREREGERGREREREGEKEREKEREREIGFGTPCQPLSIISRKAKHLHDTTHDNSSHVSNHTHGRSISSVYFFFLIL